MSGARGKVNPQQPTTAQQQQQQQHASHGVEKSSTSKRAATAARSSSTNGQDAPTSVTQQHPRMVQALRGMAEEKQMALQTRMASLESKYEVLLQNVSQEMDAKNRLIEELRERVLNLEEAFSRKSSTSSLQVPASISSSISSTSSSEGSNNQQPASDISSTSSACSSASSGIGGCVEDTCTKSAMTSRLDSLENNMTRARIDLGSLMVVYDDLQDRVYDIDRTWKNNLVFSGIRPDPHGIFETQECLESKIRTVLRNKLNIGREIVINRCQRLYNSVDGKGTRPIVVNFFKWSDKEDILRKSKILKNSGISIEEDFSRAAKLRRRELEKFLREVKAADPDKKCTFKYDKLIIEDSVFIYNQSEHRIERLPYTLSGAPALFENEEDTPSATVGRYRLSARGATRGSTNNLHLRPATTAGCGGAGTSDKPVTRAKSVECILDRIPSVTNGIAEPISLSRSPRGSSPHTAGSMSASVSSPNLTHAQRKERAARAAREKMVPNLDMQKDENEEAAEEDLIQQPSNLQGEELDEDKEKENLEKDLIDQEDGVLIPGLGVQPESETTTKCTNDTPLHATNTCSKSEKVRSLKKFIFDEAAVHAKLEELSRKKSPTPSTRKKQRDAANGHESDSSSSTSSECDSDPPLNNIVDQKEWQMTGSYIPPPRKGRRNENRKISKPRLKNHPKRGVSKSKARKPTAEDASAPPTAQSNATAKKAPAASGTSTVVQKKKAPERTFVKEEAN